jgi:hypothetical protein
MDNVSLKELIFNKLPGTASKYLWINYISMIGFTSESILIEIKDSDNLEVDPVLKILIEAKYLEIFSKALRESLGNGYKFDISNKATINKAV